MLKNDDNHHSIIKSFEEKIEQHMANTDSPIDDNAEPVNIFIADGGGMKGYAYIAICEVIAELYEGKKEILDYFDFFAGTSVGGIFALLCNRMETLKDTITEGRDVIDDIREEVFTQISPWRILTKGAAVTSKSNIIKVLKDRYGSDEELVDSTLTPAMVVSAMRSDSTQELYDPLVLKTYSITESFQDDLKDDPDEANNSSKKNALPKPTSSSTASECRVSLCEAMAATSALPGLVNRLKLSIGGHQRSVADGYCVCNSPVALALEEAMKLYPGRPIGVVVSFGFGTRENHHITKAVELAQKIHPQMHFHRIAPNHIMDNFSASETSLEEIAKMEAAVSHFVRTDEQVRKDLEVTMNKLFESKQNVLHKLKSNKLITMKQHSTNIDQQNSKPVGRKSIVMRHSLINLHSSKPVGALRRSVLERRKSVRSEASSHFHESFNETPKKESRLFCFTCSSCRSKKDVNSSSKSDVTWKTENMIKEASFVISGDISRKRENMIKKDVESLSVSWKTENITQEVIQEEESEQTTSRAAS